MKIRTTIATMNNFFDGTPGFTREQLLKLRNTAEGRPVLEGFDSYRPPVGIIREAALENDELTVEVELLKPPPFSRAPLFLAPAHDQEYNLLAGGIVNSPLDQTLPPIQT